MRRTVVLALGVSTLAAVWLGPLPELAPHRFSAHMTMHMGVVAVSAPLLALALAGGRADPARAWPGVFRAVPASAIELVVVWAWHAPVLHQMARGSTSGLVVEQGMFLASGFFVWISAVGGDVARDGTRPGAGVLALLLTSMHMTLLGALIALGPRPLYGHEPVHVALHEQHVGGAIMLLVGGVSYLAGGLALASALLRKRGAFKRSEAG